MAHNIETDIDVPRFGYSQDDGGQRFTFPRANLRDLGGRSGDVAYGAHEAILDALEGRLDTLRWTCEGASFGSVWLKDDAGRFDLACERIELARGARLTRADRGVEIVAPHASISELKLTIKGPFGGAPAVAPASTGTTGQTTAPPPAPAVPPEPEPLRQDRLQFLDSLTGKINFTVKVVLDLPVVGKRTLDQKLNIPVQQGSLNWVEIEDSLDWLEGRFLDIKHEGTKLALSWKVPIVGSSRELISWQLDNAAIALASFGRVPVRSLADYHLRPSKPGKSDDKRKLVQAFSLAAIDIALSLVAPRSVQAGGGVIMFGGDDSPGMVDLKVTGAINDARPGALRGAIGSIDTTLKDVRLGSAMLAADRLHFDDLDDLEVVFDGFSPVCISAVIHRVTATNLALQMGR